MIKITIAGTVGREPEQLKDKNLKRTVIVPMYRKVSDENSGYESLTWYELYYDPSKLPFDDKKITKGSSLVVMGNLMIQYRKQSIEEKEQRIYGRCKAIVFAESIDMVCNASKPEEDEALAEIYNAYNC